MMNPEINPLKYIKSAYEYLLNHDLQLTRFFYDHLTDNPINMHANNLNDPSRKHLKDDQNRDHEQHFKDPSRPNI